jgi:hypothetical protein
MGSLKPKATQDAASSQRFMQLRWRQVACQAGSSCWQ